MSARERKRKKILCRLLGARVQAIVIHVCNNRVLRTKQHSNRNRNVGRKLDKKIWRRKKIEDSQLEQKKKIVKSKSRQQKTTQ